MSHSLKAKLSGLRHKGYITDTEYERLKDGLRGESMDFNSCPIYIATKTYQPRKHRKKRINKKWLKRYGCEYDLMPHGQIIMVDGTIYMTKKTFEQLKQGRK